MAYALSLQAAAIFNMIAARQHFLEGTITVGRLTATPLGHVHFEDLVWTLDESGTKVTVPDGHFHVKPLDLIMRRPSTSTITNVELNGASIELSLTIRCIYAASIWWNRRKKKGKGKKETEF